MGVRVGGTKTFDRHEKERNSIFSNNYYKLDSYRMFWFKDGNSGTKLCVLKKNLLCIGVQLINNGVTVSGEQLKGLNHVCTCIVSPANSPPIQAAARIYMLDPFWSSILNIAVFLSALLLTSSGTLDKLSNFLIFSPVQ